MNRETKQLMENPNAKNLKLFKEKKANTLKGTDSTENTLLIQENEE